MGIQQSKQRNLWQSSFEFDQKNSQAGIIKLLNRQTQDAYICRKISTVDKLEMMQMDRLIDVKLSIQSPYITKLQKAETEDNREYCAYGKNYYTLFKSPYQTLKQQTLNRKFKYSMYSENQLELILQAGIKAMYFLKNIDHPHKNISSTSFFVNQNKTLILGDPFMFPKQNSPLITRNGFVYPSPELIRYQNHQIQSYNYHLSDLFTFGLVLLQVFFMTNMDCVYQKYFERLNHQAIWIKLNKVQSQSLRKKLFIILDPQPKNRQVIYKHYLKFIPSIQLFKQIPKQKFKKTVERYNLATSQVTEWKNEFPLQQRISSSQGQKTFSISTADHLVSDQKGYNYYEREYGKKILKGSNLQYNNKQDYKNHNYGHRSNQISKNFDNYIKINKNQQVNTLQGLNGLNDFQRKYEVNKCTFGPQIKRQCNLNGSGTNDYHHTNTSLENNPNISHVYQGSLMPEKYQSSYTFNFKPSIYPEKPYLNNFQPSTYSYSNSALTNNSYQNPQNLYGFKYSQTLPSIPSIQNKDYTTKQSKNYLFSNFNTSNFIKENEYQPLYLSSDINNLNSPNKSKSQEIKHSEKEKQQKKLVISSSQYPKLNIDKFSINDQTKNQQKTGITYLNNQTSIQSGQPKQKSRTPSTNIKKKRNSQYGKFQHLSTINQKSQMTDSLVSDSEDGQNIQYLDQLITNQKDSHIVFSQSQRPHNQQITNPTIQMLSNVKLGVMLEQQKKVWNLQYPSGTRYIGQIQNDRRNGMGTFYYNDGSKYHGYWFDNKMNGFGTLYYSNGKIAYQGDWKLDNFHGKGQVYNDQAILLKDIYHYQNCEDISNFEIQYDGEFVEDNKEGRGVLKLSNGQYFEGRFKSNKLHGLCKFYSINKKIIEGIWQDNILIKIVNQTIVA